MKWLTVNAKADAHEMIISGPIGQSWWDPTGTASKEFRDELNKIPKGTKINVRINSEGGSIKDGLEIYNALKARSKDVTSYVDGYALSIASVIPLAASRVISPKASVWMVHEPWSQTSGNAEDHLAAAEMLNTHGDMLADVYAEELGKPKAEMRAAMKKETWFTGSEATAFGLADETPEEDSEPAFARLDLSRFRNVPQNIFNMLSGPVRPADQKQKQNMKKETMVATLAKHGITASADWTDEQFVEAINGLAAKPAKETVVDLPINLDALEATKRIQKLEARLETERRSRVRADVLRVGENKIPNALVDHYVALAMEDEAKTLAMIEAMAEFSPGSEAARGAGGRPRITEGLTPLEKIQAEHKTPEARCAAMRKDWTALMADAEKRGRGMPVAANTYSATLVTAHLLDGAITDLQNVWAPLAAFTLDYDPDAYKPNAVCIVKHVTAGTATQVDATDFEANGNTTVAPISITPHQYTQNFQVSNSDLNNGLRMADLVTLNTALFANAVIEAAMVPITVANFGAAVVTSSAAAFGYSDLATLQAALKKSPRKNLILDGAYIARVSNVPGFFQPAGVLGGSPSAWRGFGWDIVANNTNWAGAGANIVGFACNPQAIAAVVGLPLTPGGIPGGILAMNTEQVPGLNITVAAFTWFSTKTRTMWQSLDVIFGDAAADKTAGFIVASA